MTVTPRESYGGQAARGALASLTDHLYRIGLQVASVLILARLLTPQDFGLVAMVLVVIGVGEMLRDMGLSGAAIQARELTGVQRSNLFWINSAVGLAIAVVVMSSAPLIAAAYGTPDLVAITVALAPSFFLSGLTTQHRVGLVRAMRFRRVAVIESASSTVALALGVALAWAGWGYWALVVQQVMSGVVALVLFVISDPWRPAWYRRGHGTLHFVRLGGHFLASGLAAYASNNVDSIVIGRQFGADVLGQYNRGSQLVRQPTRQVMNALGGVMAPILARFQDDRSRLSAALRDGQLAGAYPLAFVGAVAVAAPGDIVGVALGAGWEGAAPFIAAMGVGVVLRQLTSSVAAGLAACGLGRALSTYGFVSSVGAVGLVLASATRGPVAIAWVVALTPVMTWVFGYPWLARQAGIRTRALRVDGLRVAAIGVVAAAAGRLAADELADGLPQVVRLGCVAGLVLVVFGAASALPAVRRDLGRLRAMAEQARSGSHAA